VSTLGSLGSRGVVGDIRRRARETPPGRERHADLLRAVAIGAVVLGHWLVVIVTYDAGRGLDGRSALGVVGWAPPLTWLFQVMPVFFLVGGYANAASWRSARRRGDATADWLLGRCRRLLRPTTVFLAVVAVASLLARTAGVDPDLVGTAAWLAALPLWFLVVYLVAVGLTPAMHALHERAGLAVPVVLTALVGLGDLTRMGLDIPYVGEANYLLAWLAIHQVGFAWQDGRLPTRPTVAAAMAALGLVTVFGLTVLGPYPLSMVAVPGEQVQNTAPPTLALMALALAQLGVVLLLREPADRWLARSLRAWTAVVAVNAVVLTIFLWHMAAVVAVAVLLVPTGLVPEPGPGSAEWLLWRIPWIAVLLVVLAVFVAAFAWAELGARGPVAPGGPARAPMAWLGLAAAVAGLLIVGLSGRGDHGPAGLPTEALVGYGAGIALLAVAARPARR
jgi:fucose 4-O-acetylase-like acetyltransferase